MSSDTLDGGEGDDVLTGGGFIDIDTFIFGGGNDIITDYERISDHCSNVAVDILEDMIGSLEMHEYHLSEDYRQDDRFKEYFNEYKLRYKL